MSPDDDLGDWGEWKGLDDPTKLLLLRRSTQNLTAEVAKLETKMESGFKDLRAEMVAVRSRVVGAIIAVQLLMIAALLAAVLHQ